MQIKEDKREEYKRFSKNLFDFIVIKGAEN